MELKQTNSSPLYFDIHTLVEPDVSETEYWSHMNMMELDEIEQFLELHSVTHSHDRRDFSLQSSVVATNVN